MSSNHADLPIWKPSEEFLSSSNLVRFRQQVNSRYDLSLGNYGELHSWSVENIGEFWSEVWDFCGVSGAKGEVLFEPHDSMLQAKFFPRARLNFAENLLKTSTDVDADDALVFWGEDRLKSCVSWHELSAEVSRMAQALRDSGVVAGDRVAAYMPNIPETIVAMLAATSIGAIWSSCSPDFGVRGVLDRFGQIEPKVLIAADGYFYSGKEIDNLAKIEEIVDQLRSVERVVIVPYFRNGIAAEAGVGDVNRAVLYADYLHPYASGEIEFAQLPFDHPLYILFSSGTTGAPKCIVHGAGGTLLQQLKEHQLHNDVKPGDRVFYLQPVPG